MDAPIIFSKTKRFAFLFFALLLVAATVYTVALTPGDRAVVTCSGGTIFGTPSPGQVIDVCVAYTITPTSSPLPSATLTRTPTSTPTVTSVPTITSTPAPSLFFAVGPGYADVSSHDLVRSADDRLFAFAQVPFSNAIRVYWTTSPGLPSSFAGSASLAEADAPVSLDAVYDGLSSIHVLVLVNNGTIRDEVFSTTGNAFVSGQTLATNAGKVSGYYEGSEGVVGVYAGGVLHYAYWTSANHILFDGATQLDTSGNAQHPAMSAAPDGSITAAWVQTDKTVRARTLSGGVWGAVQQVSAAPAFVSTNGGISIDQGPSLLIDTNGARYLTYVEDWRVSSPYDYGRVHFVTNATGSWVDAYAGFYSHDPSLASATTIIGHGYGLDASPCADNNDMCVWQRQTNTWTPSRFAQHVGAQSFDSSPSVKPSGGPVEFLFFDDNVPTLYYGRFGP